MLTVEHLSKVLPDGRLLLKDINFSVGESEFVAILGLSGTGKTILLRCMNGLTMPDGGEVILNNNGKSLHITRSDANQIKEIRCLIGMIFQNFNLVKRRSVIENVLIGKLGRIGMIRSLVNKFTDKDLEMAYGALEKVEFFYNIGVRILEFPVTFDAAKKGHEFGMTICMGAPNVVLGRSTSGNLSSCDAINADIVNVLCSDYNPQSMLYSVFILWKQGIMTLPDAVSMISLNPAMAVGMGDTIGSIEIGKRADILIVSEQMGIPMVACTIVNGNIVYTKGDVI